MFVNAAVTSTGQREFRDDAHAQRLSVDFLHEYVLGNYRELYAAVLALDINDFNAALVVRHLLENSRDLAPDVRRREGELIARRLELMAPQRVYKLFRELARGGVNNRRTRAIMRDWTAQRRDPVFDAVKYRAGVKATMRHAHLEVPAETGTFLFTATRKVPVFTTPLFETWRRAHYGASALYELPYTVAEGLASKHGIKREQFLEKIAPQLTRLERLRLQQAGERAKATSVAADLATMPLTRLASYVLALPQQTRAARHDELHEALTGAAGRVAAGAAGSWGRVVAVLDDSFSSFGSTVKRQRPLAVALACHYLLRALATDFVGLWTSGAHDPLFVRPSGPTPLGERILDALELAPERLVVVSDGWDNSPPGLAAEVLRVWRERLDPAGATAVVHLNPVYDAAGFDVRRLAASVPTVGVRDAEDVPALVELARFAEGRAGFDELRGYLANRQDRFRQGSRSRREHSRQDHARTAKEAT
ncbi:hypothetical protein [Streptomyces sp. SID3343]|uniref:hypothetical protein n=1 Tax=Streptomyces sp. SID3343 TaxID=2690260 RepID=UPI00136D32BE|nr:hypothetical protein [Streptomyces sp. SID3343]MYW04212.1 hypothetical protein [Streptomyces sp. SID3343]